MTQTTGKLTKVQCLRGIVACTEHIDRCVVEIVSRLMKGRRIDEPVEDILDRTKLIKTYAEKLLYGG